MTSHEIRLNEVRDLAPGSTVLTRQIDPDWYAEPRTACPRPPRFEPRHQPYPQGFEAAGLSSLREQEGIILTDRRYIVEARRAAL